MMNVMKAKRALLFLAVVGALSAATVCSRAAAKTAPPPPPDVSVIRIAGEDVATYREYPARTYARDLVEVRGRVGASLLQVGGLVSKTSPAPLTTIVPLDPIWVRFQVSEAELPAFQRSDTRSLPVDLVLSDGTTHRQAGHIENTLNGVNTKTG